MRVLVVDDEAPARSELLHLLGAHEDVAADEAPGAAEALARVREARTTRSSSTSRCRA